MQILITGTYESITTKHIRDDDLHVILVYQIDE